MLVKTVGKLGAQLWFLWLLYFCWVSLSPLVAITSYYLLLWFNLGAAVCVKSTSVTISTLPRIGPFVVGQSVKFTCDVNTTANNISFDWVYVHTIGISRATVKNVSLYFHDDIIRYPWFYCMVSSSGVTVGKATKVIEIHDKSMQTNQ